MELCPKSAASRRGISSTTVIFVLLLACAGGGGYAYWHYSTEEEGVDVSELILREVERGPFDHIVLEQGEIESSSNTEIICEVKSRGGGSGTAILWVVDEGTQVEKGEKLVELDSSQLETELKQQKIIVSNARAALTSSEALLEQSRIAREEYIQGVFKTEEKAIESEIAVAQQELRKAQLNLRSTEKMVAKGLVNALQMEGDQYGVINAQSQLDAARGRLRVLQDLTKQKMLVQYDSEIESAVAAREAARSTLLEEEEKLADIESQIKACVIYAPASGVVVHGNTHNRGDSDFVVEPGALVRERQTIIRLPDPNKMQVNANINESRITLVREGMPVKIRVDAIEGLELFGRVKKVNRYAEAGHWSSGSIKEYACMIEIINPPDIIRTGMTAEVQIFVEQLSDALQIPIEGIYEHNGEIYTLIRTPQGFETRALEMGATNDTMATIESGLQEGERVVLNLRSHLNLLDLPDVVDNSTPRMDAQLASHSPLAGAADGPSDRIASVAGSAGLGSAPADGDRGGAPSGAIPSAADRVSRAFEQFDADNDGMLSTAEVDAMPEVVRQGASAADSDGDGNVSKTEMTAAMAKFARMRNQESGGAPGDAPRASQGGGIGG